MKPSGILLPLLFLSMLAGCGGGGTSTVAAGSIGGTVVKGPVGSAVIKAYAINNGMAGNQIGVATSDTSGGFNLSIGSYSGPVLLQISGGTYTDEATGASMTMAPGDVMTTVLPTVTAGTTLSGIQVTPLTSMAQAMAQNLTGGMTNTNITAANTAIGNYFTVSDIVHTQPMNPLVTNSGTNATPDMKNYGLALAALSQYAQTQGMTSSSGMVTELMNDAADGVLDGKAGSVTVMMGSMGGVSAAMSPSAGTSGLSTAMNTFMNSAQNKSGIAVTSMQTLMTKLSSSTGQIQPQVASPVMVNASLSGTAFIGPVSKGVVKAYSVNNGSPGAQISSAVTDAQGNFSIPLGSYTGPVMLQMSNGTYTDEATGTIMTMGTGDTMTAALPTVASGATLTGIWITPITSMAQARAQALSGGMNDSNITTANTAMGNYFTVSDILHTQPVNMVATGSGTGASQDMKDYGVALAAMSQYAMSASLSTSSGLVTLMMNDASDGIMNGMKGSTQISMPMGGMMGASMMSSTAGTTGLATAMTNYMNSSANSSGLTASDASIAALALKLRNSTGQIQ